MSESDIDLPPGAVPAAADGLHDADDRLRPEFVRRVMDHVESGEIEAARALVEPLHPADIADLFELVDSEERRALAAALEELLGGEVLAEMNEHVRDELIEEFEPHEVAEVAGEMETD